MLEKLQLLFEKVLGVEARDVGLNSTIDNLKGWDSMKHLELIIEIEKEFAVEFSPHEVIGLNSVERILKEINSRN